MILYGSILKESQTGDPVFEELLAREEVIYTSHISFLTDRHCDEIMRISLENASEYEKNGHLPQEVTTGKGHVREWYGREIV